LAELRAVLGGAQRQAAYSLAELIALAELYARLGIIEPSDKGPKINESLYTNGGLGDVLE